MEITRQHAGGSVKTFAGFANYFKRKNQGVSANDERNTTGLSAAARIAVGVVFFLDDQTVLDKQRFVIQD